MLLLGFRGVFGALEMAFAPCEVEVAIVIVCGLPKDGVDPPIGLALEQELKLLLKGNWWRWFWGGTFLLERHQG